jgi:uncharacterized membrane protein YqjE
MKDTPKIRQSLHELEAMKPLSASPQRPISSIFQEIGTHLSEILRSEFQLARVELRQDFAEVAKASLWLVVGGVFAMYAFGLMLLSAVYGLGEVLPLWASALIIGTSMAFVAAVLLLIGRRKLKVTSLRPDKTLQTLQENVTWLKKQTE